MKAKHGCLARWCRRPALSGSDRCAQHLGPTERDARKVADAADVERLRGVIEAHRNKRLARGVA